MIGVRGLVWAGAIGVAWCVAAAEPVVCWRFDGSDAKVVRVEKGARIVAGQGRGKSLRLDSARARAVVKDVANVPDLSSVERPFTAMIRVRPDAGVVSDSTAAMAKMCNSRRLTKFVEAMRDGQWHSLALTFDPMQRGNEYSVYLDWDDPKSPRRFTSTYPKDSGSKISLPLTVKGSTVTFGGAICWGLFSLDYQGLIDDVALYTTALTGEEIVAASK